METVEPDMWHVQRQEVRQYISRSNGEQLVGIAHQNYTAGGMDHSQDTRQHLQGQHAGLVYNHQIGVAPVDVFIQKIIVRNLAQGAVDGAGSQAGAVRQVAARLTCWSAEHHASIAYCSVLNQSPD